jgi:hypothetical protein
VDASYSIRERFRDNSTADLGLTATPMRLLHGFQLNLELGDLLCKLLDDLAEVRNGAKNHCPAGNRTPGPQTVTMNILTNWKES